MPVKMRLWRVQEDRLMPVVSGSLGSEEQLEDWLANDISMVSDDLLVIGRQVESDLGGVLDLLAIDGKGDLAVLELKKDRTPRDVVAQALHYAAWVRTLGWEEIDRLAREHHDGTPLSETYERRFGRSVPDSINGSHRIYIVAAEMDSVSESIVRYLSQEYSIGINVVFFRYFQEEDGREYVGRSWLMEPSEVEDRGEGRASKRRHHPSVEEFRALAEERGVVGQYDALFAFFKERAATIRRTQTNVAFCFDEDGAVNALFSVYPGRSSGAGGLRADIRTERLASALGVPETAIRDALRGEPVDDGWSYGEVRYFPSTCDVDALLQVLSAGDCAGAG